jgi:flavodoxin
MTKTLIVYHSRSGNTRHVAQTLARRLDADLEEVRIVQPLEGALGDLMCAIETLAGLTPALRRPQHDPAAYELVLIGTPVWFWNLPSPMLSWFEGRRLKHRVGFFCTMGGSGAQRVFETMAALAGRQPVATLALTEDQIDGDCDLPIDAFVRRLQTGTQHRPARARAGARALHAAA